MAKKQTKKLDAQEQPRVPYKMPPPNDDQQAYGWDLRRVRRPPPDKTCELGPPIFEIKQPYDVRLEYGMDIQFLDPKFVNLRLSQSEIVQKALVAVKEQKYSADALAKLSVAIKKVFDELMIDEITKRFHQLAPTLAQFYAARQAYMDKYGKD